ncbi:hypothetical protein BJX62DRAFT_231822 [Aspergillus germanicus]
MVYGADRHLTLPPTSFSLPFAQYCKDFYRRKVPGERMSSETTAKGKSLQMALETPISYPMTLRYEEGPRRGEVWGQMDYCLWYGKLCEAETFGYIAGGPCLSVFGPDHIFIVG